MSTNSTIVLKVNTKDVGRIKKCDLTKCNVKRKKTFRHEILPNYSFIEQVIKGIKLPQYLEIYHHWDGYPSGLGEWLLEHYSNYEDVLNLMLIGDCSSIIKGVVPYIGFNNMPTPHWQREKWEENKPCKHDTMPEQTHQYQYLALQDEKNPSKVHWYWKDDNTWHDLKTGKFVKL